MNRDYGTLVQFEERTDFNTICVDQGIICMFPENDHSIFPVRGGVYSEDGKLVGISGHIGGMELAPRSVGDISPAFDGIVKRNGKVLYMGVFVPHWGHFLVDMIYRLYHLERFRDYQIAYVGTEAITGNYLDFLIGYGIGKERLIRITGQVQFEQVVVNEPCAVPQLYYSRIYRGIFDSVKKYYSAIGQKPLRSFEKIYFSRQHFRGGGRKETGEKEIETIFRRNRYHILHPEELSLQEQIFFISHASMIACVSGTIAHNLVFSNTNCTWIILEKASIVNLTQVMLEQMMPEIETIHINIDKTKKKKVEYGTGPFWMGITEDLKEFFTLYQFEQNVSEYCVKNYLIYMKLCFVRWSKNCLKKLWKNIKKFRCR